MRICVEEQTARVVRVDVNRTRLTRLEFERVQTQLRNSKTMCGAANRAGAAILPVRIRRFISLHRSLLAKESVADLDVCPAFAVNAEAGDLNSALFGDDVEHDAVVACQGARARRRCESVRCHSGWSCSEVHRRVQGLETLSR